MESFEIQLLADRFLIEPLENGLYRIMEGENKVGVIFPEPDGDQAAPFMVCGRNWSADLCL